MKSFLLVFIILLCFFVTGAKASTSDFAYTVKYTYTTQEFSLQGLEDWQLAFLDDWYYGRLVKSLAGRKHQLSIQAECNDLIFCGPSLWSYILYTISPGETVVYDSASYTYIDSLFTDPRLRSFTLSSNSNIIPTVWEMIGAEYQQVGDFKLNNNGDEYSFSTSSVFGDSGDFSPEAYYCSYTFGDVLDFSNQYPTHCLNGQQAESFRTIDLGQGTWTRQVSQVPLPATLPLLPVGLFALAFFRRRKVK